MRACRQKSSYWALPIMLASTTAATGYDYSLDVLVTLLGSSASPGAVATINTASTTNPHAMVSTSMPWSSPHISSTTSVAGAGPTQTVYVEGYNLTFSPHGAHLAPGATLEILAPQNGYTLYDAWPANGTECPTLGTNTNLTAFKGAQGQYTATYQVVDRAPRILYCAHGSKGGNCSNSPTFSLNFPDKAASSNLGTGTARVVASSSATRPTGRSHGPPVATSGAGRRWNLSFFKLFATLLVVFAVSKTSCAEALDLVLDSSIHLSNSEASSSGREHNVIVGGPSRSAFDPQYVHAAIGDIVQFDILDSNHTVTQSSPQWPCRPSGTFDSSTSQAVADDSIPFAVNLFVVTSAPQYFFSRGERKLACQLTDMFVINPPKGWRSATTLNSAAVTPSSSNAISASITYSFVPTSSSFGATASSLPAITLGNIPSTTSS